MKKFLSLLSSIALCMSLVSCGGGNSDESSTESIESKVKRSVESYIEAKILLQYDTSDDPSITYYVDEIGENEFEVTGKVTVKDKYGDSYSGNYDATVQYNPETDKCQTNVDIDSLYKTK